MEQIPPPKEVKILETAEDIQERREQVTVIAYMFGTVINVAILIASVYRQFFFKLMLHSVIESSTTQLSVHMDYTI